MTAPYDSRPDTRDHIRQVAARLNTLADQLRIRVQTHDLSKLVSPEVEIFNEVTPLLKQTEYGSDAYKAGLTRMGPALAHHYAHNRHHPEYHPNGVADMTLLDLCEMLCDWLAATGRSPNGDIQKSIQMNAERFGYGAEIQRLLTNSLADLTGTPSGGPHG